MRYTTLGKTGIRVSRLGFGAMRLPMKEGKVDRDLAVPMMHRAFEAGVNYIDTAVGYCNEDSQRAVGDGLKGWRDKVTLSTKNGYFGEDEKEWWKNLENSLERLGTDHIDIYNTHGIAWKTWEESVAPRVSKWMGKAKDQGLIRHICTSFHDSNDSLRKVVDTGFYESVTLQYNLLDRSLEDGIAYARSKGMGVVVMGPVGGGRLGSNTDALKKLLPAGVSRVPVLALRFVMSNPCVNIALSGMGTMEQVEENLKAAENPAPLSPAEIEAIWEQLGRLQKMTDLYCSGCDYCKPCPSDVEISSMFRMYNEARVYGVWKHAKASYKWHLENWKVTADLCKKCGTCLPKCPQKIPIPDRLEEVHKALSGS